MSAQVMSWILHDGPRSLCGSELVVALVLAEHANPETGTAYPSVPRIARMSRLSDRQVTRVLASLVESGVLSVAWEATNRRPKAYKFVGFEVTYVSPLSRSGGDIRVTPEQSRGDTINGLEVTPMSSLEVTPVSPKRITLRTNSKNREETSRAHAHANSPQPVFSSNGGSAHPPPDQSAGADIRVARQDGGSVMVSDWQPSDASLDWAVAQGFSWIVERETPKFVQHYLSTMAERQDWDAAWRGWMLRSREFSNGKANPSNHNSGAMVRNTRKAVI